VEDLSLDEKIILEWILEDKGRRVWTGCTWIRIGTIGWIFLYGNEYPPPIW